jgi:hypothetical protein
VVRRAREFAIRKQPFICEIRQCPESRNLRFKVDRAECDHPTCRSARPASIKVPSRDWDTKASTRSELQPACLKRCRQQRSTRLHRQGRYPPCSLARSCRAHRVLGTLVHRSSKLCRDVQTPSGRERRWVSECGYIHDASARPARWVVVFLRNSLAPQPQHAVHREPAVSRSCRAEPPQPDAPRRRTPP